MRIVFTGSSKPCDDEPDGCMNFNAYYTDEIGSNCIMEAFADMLNEMGITDSGKMKELEKSYLEKIIDHRSRKK